MLDASMGGRVGLLPPGGVAGEAIGAFSVHLCKEGKCGVSLYAVSRCCSCDEVLQVNRVAGFLVHLRGGM